MFKWRWYLYIGLCILSAGCASVATTTPLMPTTTRVIPSTALVTPTIAPVTPTTAPTETLLPPVPSKPWVKTFEGPDYGAFLDIALTEDGNILAAGATNHFAMPSCSNSPKGCRIPVTPAMG